MTNIEKTSYENLQGAPIFETSPEKMDPKEFQKLIEKFVTEGNERAATIEIKENNEPLVDLRTIPNLLMPNVCDKMPPFVREGIFNKLKKVQEKLQKQNLGIKVFYALRPVEIQKQLFKSAKLQIRKENPELTDEKDIESLASKYIAPLSIAPHCTGAAIDLCLYDLNTKKNLDYGTQYPDFIPATMTEHPSVTGKSRQNRLNLRQIMAEEGLWNYPAEWWHFSFGDRGCASFTNQPNAIYGIVEEAKNISNIQDEMQEFKNFYKEI